MNRHSNIDKKIQLLDKQRKRNSSFDKTTSNHTPTIISESNKLLLNSITKQPNKTFHYSSSNQGSLNRSTQKQSEQKQKILLEEILRGSHSNVSQTYLTNIINDKMNRKFQKQYTCEDITSYTVFNSDITFSQLLSSFENIIIKETQKFSDFITLIQFEELLEKLQIKEQEGNITLFSELKQLFQKLTGYIKQEQQQQQESLKKQINEMQNQISELNNIIINYEKQVKNNVEDVMNCFLLTLRQQSRDQILIESDIQDSVHTYKPSDKIIDNFQNEKILENSKILNNYFLKNKSQNNQKNNITQNLNLDLQQLNNQKNQQILGYQEEFMARINEFSESWRQQALKEKRF